MSRFPKKLKFGSDVRLALLRGIGSVADSVAATLGPKGRNVAINQPFGPPLVVHDGVTVAKAIDLTDPFEDMGAQLIKFAAQKTNDKAGDGTTTATILARSVLEKGMEIIAAGGNPMVLKKQIEDSLVDVMSELSKLVKKVDSKSEMSQIATISSTDSAIGALVADAISKVGKAGVVDVEEGKSLVTTVEYKSGMEIDRGYLSPNFVTDQGRVESVIEDPYILVTDKRFSYNFEIVPFIEKFLKETGSKNLVIFAGEIVEEALATLVVNHMAKNIRCVAIQAPAFGGRRTDELWDIATLTGGTPILSDSGRSLDSVQVSELGRAGKIVADRDKSTIYDGRGEKESISARIKDLEEQIKVANTDFDKDIKKERLAKLSGGVAVIYVGGTTEVEMRERKERVIDAVNATKAAVEDGIVAGGEITLMKLAESDIWKKHSNPGAEILRSSLRVPFKILMENAGIDYAHAWSMLSGTKYPTGIDVTDGTAKDMIKSGIIDPVKVTRSALENAVSVATMGMTTSVLISEPYKTDK